MPKTIKSVQLQREDGFGHEHIIVDNASSDNTKDVVEGFMKDDPRIKYFRNEQNLGAAAASNIGLKNATSDLVLPLDDDDLLLRGSLQIHFDFMEDRGLDWSFTYAINVTEDGQVMGEGSDRDINYDPDPDKFFEVMMDYNQLTNGAVIFKRSAAIEVGEWDEKILCQDWDMWLKLIHGGYKYKLNPAYTLLYRVHQNRLTTVHSVDGTYERDKEAFRERYSAKREK